MELVMPPLRHLRHARGEARPTLAIYLETPSLCLSLQPLGLPLSRAPVVMARDTMSALQPATDTPETPEQVESSLHHAEYIDNASKYDGSRTPPQKIALVHALKRDGRTVNAICQILSMSPLTVKAIIARGDDLITDARMLLKANALGFAADAIQASRVAAEKGKIEGISAMLDRLDVTQPPKGQQGSQVAVQINLNGGAEPLSLAKVGGESLAQGETLSNQARIDDVNITPPIRHGEVVMGESLTTTIIPHTARASSGPVSQQDTVSIQAHICQPARDGNKP